jgi:PAS domain S-box-containing protein
MYLVGALALFIVQAATIAALWIQRSRRRDSEVRNLAILQAVPDLMFLQDRDGVFLDYHAPSPDLLVLPPAQFIGRKMQDVLPTELLEQIGPLFARVWESSEPIVGEYAIDIAGERRHYECRLVRCAADRVLSVVRDVTERVRAEVALVESEQRYALATAAGGAGVWDWNLATNEIYVDPRLKSLLGFQDHEIANRLDDWGQRLHPDDRARVMECATDHISGTSPTYEVEHRMLHKDGSVRWFVARGSVLHENGRPARLVGTDIDITDQKQAAERLRNAQIEMERMSRLAAFGQLTASIAHEVSQPLTTIIMNARACLRWLAGDAPNMVEVRATLLDVIEAGKRADDIIRRNRGLFRDHVVEKRRVNLNDVIAEVVALASTRLELHRVRVQLLLCDQLPAVLGDRIELSQVLLNLMFNGIDSMQDVAATSRVLTVSTELIAHDEVQVSVRDAGAGLSGVNVDRLFTTGYTTKPTGTGVGLSICKTIAEAHGGRVWATPNDGPGATFSFTVPVAVAVQEV